MMTKKDFIAVAKALKAMKPEKWTEKMGVSESVVVHVQNRQFDDIVDTLCGVFHGCSGRFDRTRFRDFIYGC